MLNECAVRFWKVSEEFLGRDQTPPQNCTKYFSHLLYKLSRERAVGNPSYPSAIEGLTTNMNSLTGLWARCSTSLLLDCESLWEILSLSAETKRRVRLATNYLFTSIVTLMANILKTKWVLYKWPEKQSFCPWNEGFFAFKISMEFTTKFFAERQTSSSNRQSNDINFDLTPLSRVLIHVLTLLRPWQRELSCIR